MSQPWYRSSWLGLSRKKQVKCATHGNERHYPQDLPGRQWCWPPGVDCQVRTQQGRKHGRARFVDQVTKAWAHVALGIQLDHDVPCNCARAGLVRQDKFGLWAKPIDGEMLHELVLRLSQVLSCRHIVLEVGVAPLLEPERQFAQLLLLLLVPQLHCLRKGKGRGCISLVFESCTKRARSSRTEY